MAEARRKAGSTEDMIVRRVGHRHAVITPSRTSHVVDINAVINTIERLKQRRSQAEATKAQAEQTIKQLSDELSRQEGFLLAFNQLSIDRMDGDPEVPLAAPAADDPSVKP